MPSDYGTSGFGAGVISAAKSRRYALSRDGRYLAVALEEGAVFVLSLRDGIVLRRFSVPGSPDAVNFGRAGQTLLWSGAGGEIRRWYFMDQTEPLVIEVGEYVRYLDTSPDGYWLLAQTRGSLRIWHQESGTKWLDVNGESVHWRFTLDSRYFAVAVGSEVRLWRCRNPRPEPLVIKRPSTIDFIEVMDEAPWLYGACEGQDPSPFLYDYESGDEIRPLLAPSHQSLTALAVAPNGRWAAFGTDEGVVWLQELGPTPLIFELRGHESAVRTLDFTRDSSRLISGSDDTSVRLWPVDAHADNPLVRKIAPRGLRGGLVKSPDESSVVVYLPDRGCEVYPGMCGQTVDEDRRRSLIWPAFSPDGRHWLTADETGGVFLSPRGSSGGGHRVIEHSDPVHWAAWARDRAILLTQSWKVAKVTDVRKGEVMMEAFSHGFPPSMSADGRCLLTGGRGQEAWVYRAGEGPQPVCQIPGPIDLAQLSLNGRFALAIEADRQAALWSIPETERWPRDRRELGAGTVHVSFTPDGAVMMCSVDGSVTIMPVEGDATPIRLTGHRDAVQHAAFLPEGQLVATAGRDGRVGIWRVNEDAAPLMLEGHQGPVLRVGFVGSTNHVVSLGLDGTLRLWPVALHPLALLEQLKRATPYQLTARERRMLLHEPVGVSVER